MTLYIPCSVLLNGRRTFGSKHRLSTYFVWAWFLYEHIFIIIYLTQKVTCQFRLTHIINLRFIFGWVWGGLLLSVKILFYFSWSFSFFLFFFSNDLRWPFVHGSSHWKHSVGNPKKVNGHDLQCVASFKYLKCICLLFTFKTTNKEDFG